MRMRLKDNAKHFTFAQNCKEWPGTNRSFHFGMRDESYTGLTSPRCIFAAWT